MTEIARVAVFGGSGKTGRAVIAALQDRAVQGVPIGRREWADQASLVESVRDADAAYLIAPNLHPDEPAYIGEALRSLGEAGVERVVYHSVASPYAPAMPHHLGKAAAEDLVRRSGLSWTILQPGAYVQNFDLTGTLRVPYDVHVRFGFLELSDLGQAAAAVLIDAGHDGATYELASCQASVAELAARAGVGAETVPKAPLDGLSPREQEWLIAMFGYYDQHGLPVGTRPLRSLLENYNGVVSQADTP